MFAGGGSRPPQTALEDPPLAKIRGNDAYRGFGALWSLKAKLTTGFVGDVCGKLVGTLVAEDKTEMFVEFRSYH